MVFPSPNRHALFSPPCDDSAAKCPLLTNVTSGMTIRRQAVASSSLVFYPLVTIRQLTLVVVTFN